MPDMPAFYTLGSNDMLVVDGLLTGVNQGWGEGAERAIALP